jgi:L-fucose isomerase-like protein
VDRKGNYENSLRNSAVIGIAQLTGTLRKMERDYKIIVGSVHDERAYAKIGAYMRAAKAVKDLSEANIGIIGHVFRGMYDLELSKTFFKNSFGANVIQIQSSHLLDAWKEVDTKEIDIKQLTSRFEKKNVTDDDIFRSLHLAKAMEKIVDRFSLDAMCFLDQHFVQKQVLTSARMGASLIMEKTDKSVNCEGDLAGLIVMMLMRSISGKAALMGEWGEYDEDENAVFVIGHGIGTPDMAEDESKIKLTVLTDRPAIQLYAGAMSERVGKNGVTYKTLDSYCLETQAYIDAVNQPSFPTAILKKGEKHYTKTTFKCEII